MTKTPQNITEYRNYLKTVDADHLHRMLEDADMDDGFNKTYRKAIKEEIGKRS